jgi:hypothetical protein
MSRRNVPAVASALSNGALKTSASAVLAFSR